MKNFFLADNISCLQNSQFDCRDGFYKQEAKAYLGEMLPEEKSKDVRNESYRSLLLPPKTIFGHESLIFNQNFISKKPMFSEQNYINSTSLLSDQLQFGDFYGQKGSINFESISSLYQKNAILLDLIRQIHLNSVPQYRDILSHSKNGYSDNFIAYENNWLNMLRPFNNTSKDILINSDASMLKFPESLESVKMSNALEKYYQQLHLAQLLIANENALKNKFDNNELQNDLKTQLNKAILDEKNHITLSELKNQLIPKILNLIQENNSKSVNEQEFQKLIVTNHQDANHQVKSSSLINSQFKNNEYVSPGAYSKDVRMQKILCYKNKIKKWRDAHPISRSFTGRSWTAVNKPRVKGKFVSKKSNQ